MANSPTSFDRQLEPEWDRLHQIEREADEKRLAALQRDAERERLLWLSLPHNDHPTYYSDSDGEGEPPSDGLSPALDVAAAASALDTDPYLAYAAQSIDRADPVASDLRHIPAPPGPAQRYRYHPALSAAEEERARLAVAQKVLHGHRAGNRGNKLRRKEGVRYASRGKLSHWNDGKVEKEINDSAKQRTKALQRASIRSLLDSALPASPSPELLPHRLPEVWPEAEESNLRGAYTEDEEAQQLRNGGPSSERTSSRRNGKARAAGKAGSSSRSRSKPEEDPNDPSIVLRNALDNLGATTTRTHPGPPNLTSTSLAPTLLRPVLTPLALLESDTLRHTFRNGHIGALSKTALDLIESESVVSRALGRCFAALESGGQPGWGAYQDSEQRARKRRRKDAELPLSRGESAVRSGKGKAAEEQQGQKARSSDMDQDEDVKSAQGSAAAVDGAGENVGAGEAPTYDGASNPNVPHDLNADPNLVPLGLAADGVTPLSELEMRARLGRQSNIGVGGAFGSSAPSASMSLSDFAPALNQLEHLFITPGGIDIPLYHSPAPVDAGSSVSSGVPGVSFGVGGVNPLAGSPMVAEGSQGTGDASGPSAPSLNTAKEPPQGSLPPQSPAGVGPAYTNHLDADQQRALVRAALECVYELAQDSREYIERLQEVREKLAHVKLGRARVWGAVRGWALGEVEDELERRRIIREQDELEQQGGSSSGTRYH
ncbi:hypothetical protein V8E36_008334 [Tilletia maclaganii]